MSKSIDMHEPGTKDDGDKPMADLLLGFGLALEDVARLATFGAKKYSRGGWQHVENAEERYTAAMIRHLLKIGNEEVDPETGLLHLTAVAWNALAALELKLRSESENLSLWPEEDLEEFRHLTEAVDVGGDVYWYRTSSGMGRNGGMQWEEWRTFNPFKTSTKTPPTPSSK